MAWIVWGLFGALVGISASQRRGFSIVAGILGGLLLGPLAVLMYFVSGVGPGDRHVRCPQCAEWIEADAKVCKHCGRDVYPATIRD